MSLTRYISQIELNDIFNLYMDIQLEITDFLPEAFANMRIFPASIEAGLYFSPETTLFGQEGNPGCIGRNIAARIMDCMAYYAGQNTSVEEIPDELRICLAVCHNNEHWTGLVINIHSFDEFYAAHKKMLGDRIFSSESELLNFNDAKNAISHNLGYSFDPNDSMKDTNNADLLFTHLKSLNTRIEARHFDSHFDASSSDFYFQRILAGLATVGFTVEAVKCSPQIDNTCGDHTAINLFSVGMFDRVPSINERNDGITSADLRELTDSIRTNQSDNVTHATRIMTDLAIPLDLVRASEIYQSLIMPGSEVAQENLVRANKKIILNKTYLDAGFRLRTLDLSSANLGSSFMPKLRTFLDNYRCLEELFVNNNEIGGRFTRGLFQWTSDVERLATTLIGYTNMKSLNFNNTGMDIKDSQPVCKMLLTMSQLTQFNYEDGYHIGDKYIDWIKEYKYLVCQRAELLSGTEPVYSQGCTAKIRTWLYCLSQNNEKGLVISQLDLLNVIYDLTFYMVKIFYLIDFDHTKWSRQSDDFVDGKPPCDYVTWLEANSSNSMDRLEKLDPATHHSALKPFYMKFEELEEIWKDFIGHNTSDLPARLRGTAQQMKWLNEWLSAIRMAKEISKEISKQNLEKFIKGESISNSQVDENSSNENEQDQQAVCMTVTTRQPNWNEFVAQETLKIAETEVAQTVTAAITEAGEAGENASSQTLIAPDSFQQYRESYSKYLQDNNATVKDLQLACQHLYTAIAKGDERAKLAAIHSTEGMMGHEMRLAIEKEYYSRLQLTPVDAPRHREARVEQFLLLYSKRYSNVYSDSYKRFEEIREALWHLVFAENPAAPAIRDFANKHISGYPQSCTVKSVTADAWKILAIELAGQDLFDDYIENGHARTSYPYRIISRESMAEVLQQCRGIGPQQALKHFRDYSAWLNQDVLKVNCTRNRNGRLTIHIPEGRLARGGYPVISFMDPEQGHEIGRIEQNANGFTFKGYGQAIQLEIEEKLRGSSYVFDNADGEIALVADFDSGSSLHLSADVRIFKYNGREIRANHDMLLESRGEMNLSAGSHIDGKSNFSIKSESLSLSGHVKASGHCELEIKKAIVSSRNHTMHAGRGLDISAGALKEIYGRFESDTYIMIDSKDGVFLTGNATLKCAWDLVVNANKLLGHRKASVISGGKCELNIEEACYIGINNTWSAKVFDFKGKRLENYSDKISGEFIFIRCHDALTNHASGQITASMGMRIRGQDFYNGGRLKGNGEIRLNGIYVHGAASWSAREFYQAVSNKQLHAQQFSIVAGIVLNAVGYADVESLRISALIFAGLEITRSDNIQIFSLWSPVISVHIPKFTVIWRNLKAAYHSLFGIKNNVENEKGDFLAILSEIGSILMKILLVAAWIFKIVFPMLIKPIDLTVTIISMLCNLPNLIMQCFELNRRLKDGEPFEVSDLYELLASMGSIFPQAAALYSQLDSSAFNIDFNAPTPPLDPVSIATTFASIWLPTDSNYSLINCSSGFRMIPNQSTYALISATFCESGVALNNSSTFLYSWKFLDGKAAWNSSNMGYYLFRSGLYAVNNDFVNVSYVDESSRILADKVIWQTNGLNDRSKVDANYIQTEGSEYNKHQGEFHAEVIVYKSPTPDIEGVMHGKTVALELDHHESLDDILSHTGHYRGLLVDENLIVNSNDGVSLDNVNYDLTYSLQVHGRDVYINRTNLHSTGDIILIGKEGDVWSDKSSIKSDKTVLLYSVKGSVYTNYSNIHGYETFLLAKQSVVNTAGDIIADEYLQAYAEEGNVENHCDEVEADHQYGKGKDYIPGRMIGGKGEHHDGKGALIHGKEIIIDGSENISEGDQEFEGVVKATARAHSEVTYHKKGKNLLGRKWETIETKDLVQHPVIASLKGSNYFNSPKGEIYLSSAIVFAGKDNSLIANNDVVLTGLIVNITIEKSSSNLYGLNGSKEVVVTQQAAPTLMQENGNGKIESVNGIVRIDNAQITGGGTLSIYGKDVIITQPVLTIRRSRTEWGVNLTILGVSSFNPGYSMTVSFNALIKSGNAKEGAANAWNFFIDSMNMFNATNSAINKSSIGPLISGPVIAVNFTQVSFKGEYEYLPNNEISHGTVNITADDTLTVDNSVRIHAGTANISACVINQRGATLHTRETVSTQTVSAGLDIKGDPVVGFSFSESETSQTVQVQQQFIVDDTETIIADSLNLKDATIHAGKIEGHVQKERIETSLNTFSNQSMGFSADSNGYVSANYSEINQGSIGNVSGIQSANNQLMADSVETSTPHEYQHGYAVGASVNLDAVANGNGASEKLSSVNLDLGVTSGDTSIHVKIPLNLPDAIHEAGENLSALSAKANDAIDSIISCGCKRNADTDDMAARELQDKIEQDIVDACVETALAQKPGLKIAAPHSKAHAKSLTNNQVEPLLELIATRPEEGNSSDSGVGALKKVSSSLVISQALKKANQYVPGLGAYLQSKLMLWNAGSDFNNRRQTALQNGSEPTDAFVCAMAGTITKVTTSIAGYAGLTAGATGAAVGTGGTSLPETLLFWSAAGHIVDNGSNAAGNLAENLCHDGFRSQNKK